MYVKVFVIDIGGCIFYLVIMVCLLEIFVIVGIKEIIDKVKVGDILVVNGIIGDVIIDLIDVEKFEFEVEVKVYVD